MKIINTLRTAANSFNYSRIRRLVFAPAVFFVATISGVSMGQESSPSRIDPASLSRLPGLLRDDMTAEHRPLFDRIAGAGRSTPMLGPGGVSLYMPRVADGMDLINQYLRYDS